MAAIHERGDARTQQELMIALADTGECIDFWDIEVWLRAHGYSRDEARMATANAAIRRTLNERCRHAQMTANPGQGDKGDR